MKTQMRSEKQKVKVIFWNSHTHICAHTFIYAHPYADMHPSTDEQENTHS